MTPRSRTLFASFMLVALVAVGSNWAARPAFFEGFLWDAPLDPSTAEAVNLAVQVPAQSTSLEYSTQAEIFRFSLVAEKEFTLRYLTVNIRSAGLSLSEKAQDWKVYALKDGRPDFSQLVGYGEQWEESFLRLRFSSSPSLGYFGQAGKNTFALVTPVLKMNGAEAPWLSVSVPALLPEALRWSFVADHEETPWIDVTGSFDASAVSGLPSEEFTKR